MKAKKKKNILINFSHLFHLKYIFSFFLFNCFSLRLLFFLPFSFSFFFSLPHLLFASPTILGSSSSPSPSSPIFFANPSSPIFITDLHRRSFITQSFIADLHRRPISGFHDGGLGGFHGGCGQLILVGRGGGSVCGVFILVGYCSEIEYFIVVDIIILLR